VEATLQRFVLVMCELLCQRSVLFSHRAPKRQLLMLVASRITVSLLFPMDDVALNAYTYRRFVIAHLARAVSLVLRAYA